MERVDPAMPHDEPPDAGHGAAHEDVVVHGDGPRPHGPALLGRLLGVVFQRDGGRLGSLDGRVGLVAPMGPVRRDQRRRRRVRSVDLVRRRRVANGAVMILGRGCGFRNPSI